MLIVHFGHGNLQPNGKHEIYILGTDESDSIDSHGYVAAAIRDTQGKNFNHPPCIKE